MSAGDVIHRIVTGTKKQPGGGWGGVVSSPPYLWEGVTYRKVSQHTLVSKDCVVARDKINVSSENERRAWQPPETDHFFLITAVCFQLQAL